jgi:hypothetical protein
MKDHLGAGLVKREADGVSNPSRRPCDEGGVTA